MTTTYYSTNYDFFQLPYAYLRENMHHGAVKAAEIKLDIAKGCFDPTLEKYNPVPLHRQPKAEMTPARSDKRWDQRFLLSP